MAVVQVDVAASEAALRAKYPTRRIKEGSFRLAEASGPFAGKQTVVILCVDCDAERRIAVQDLFQVERCVDCAAKKRRKARSERRAAKPEVVAAREAKARLDWEKLLAWGAVEAAKIDAKLAAERAKQAKADAKLVTA